MAGGGVALIGTTLVVILFSAILIASFYIVRTIPAKAMVSIMNT